MSTASRGSVAAENGNHASMHEEANLVKVGMCAAIRRSVCRAG